MVSDENTGGGERGITRRGKRGLKENRLALILIVLLLNEEFQPESPYEEQEQ
jgi:hypothetical protein